MTAEEIKDKYSMKDILGMYGLTVGRGGFICCPFHDGDRDPSLKVYQKDFYCFGCGASGDIFSFVQMMDNLTFQEAFRRLGGDSMDAGARMRAYHAKKAREMKEKECERAWKRIRDNLDAISDLRERIPRLEPFSEEYCQAQREMTRQIALFDYLWENEGVLWSH